jgi:hypothetical protein
MWATTWMDHANDRRRLGGRRRVRRLDDEITDADGLKAWLVERRGA